MVSIDPLNPLTLRSARRFIDMTQKALGDAVGVGKSTICEIEKGKHDPKLSQWIRIVKVVQEALEAKNG